MKGTNTPFISGWRLFFVVYIALIGISNAGQFFFTQPVPVHQKTKQVLLTSAETFNIFPLSYFEMGKEHDSLPVILYLTSKAIITPEKLHLPQKISRKARVIIPDFNGSLSKTGEVNDYSFHNKALYARQLADSLDINNFHIIGDKHGGLIALHLNELSSANIKSLTLMSSLGVQELELLGGYNLNHALYTGHWFLLNFIKYGVPHFGLITDRHLKMHEVKALNDSDQRLARPLFSQVDVPVFIQHCTEDDNGVVGIAIEHQRLVPQSVLHTYECEHLNQSPEVIPDYIDFLKKAEAGRATIRSSASNARVAQSLIPYTSNESTKATGYSLAIIMVLIIFSTFITEDLTCIGAGLMVARGLLGFWPAVIACLLGIFIGDILIFLLGKWLGNSVVHRAPVKWFISEKDLERSHYWFQAKGPVIIIVSRFIPGSRFPTYLSAGILGSSFLMFMFYFGVASMIWTPLLVGLSVLVGQELIFYFTLYQDYAIWVLLGAVLLLLAIFKVLIPLFTFRGRRLLAGRWRRIKNWEFWPPYILYAPVLLYIGFLGIKYRGLTVFTAANPGIEDGGFIGESKSSILDGIERRKSVAEYELIEASLPFSEKKKKVLAFLEKQKAAFPVVLKPDRGERGRKVVIPKSRRELLRSVEAFSEDFIIQEYIEGKEFGIFYYRDPEEGSGSIFSVTRKELQELEGDGEHTLEHLILSHERAVCLANTHFENHIDELYKVPEKGERIPLVELGTHARGALFFDAEAMITHKLTKKIDEISNSFEGFYFGRYDIKVPSREDLKEGKNLKVIELNGVTSESTNIYDPKYSYWKAVGILCRQWHLCFKTGAQLNRRGFVKTSASELLSKLMK